MRIAVTGATGFLAYHLIKYLKAKGYWVRGIDIKQPVWERPPADELIYWDLRQPSSVLFNDIDQVYHLAADMGGIGYIENNKANIVCNNTLININTINICRTLRNIKKFLFTSSACVYPTYLQEKEVIRPLAEEEAYPAEAEDGYGWEKLMMERICRHVMEDYGLPTYVARLHNIYGEMGTYQGGREKSPAALCRKVAKSKDFDEIEIWGDGKQTRSYCYAEDCVEALHRLMMSDYHEPINIGTDRLVSINKLADIIIEASGKQLSKVYNHTASVGVRGRNADITKAKEILGWTPQISLETGISRTYKWITEMVKKG